MSWIQHLITQASVKYMNSVAISIHTPFLFKHNHLTSIAACVNSKSIPANPITVNV